MATMAASRKTFSIQDYPEHLNPFHEDDNHNKIRFWTIGKKLNRSNSISFTGLKELKNSWAFRSFMKKGKKQSSSQSQDKTYTQSNGEISPIVFRRAMQYSSFSSGTRSTVGSPERYVYGGSVTPLPRSRFQERLRSTSHYDTNSLSATPRMARSEVTGSKLSIGSTNPFDEDEPVPPVKAARRKKKRAPPPPPVTSADVSVASVTSHTELQITESNDNQQPNNQTELDLEELNMNIELKIVEDDDVKEAVKPNGDINKETEDVEPSTVVITEENVTDKQESEQKETTTEESIVVTGNGIRNSTSEDDIQKSVEFPKIDIIKYRRNSSVNEDDIRLRRGNLEDFQPLSNKRSKSLNNTSDTSYTTFDINSNESVVNTDANGNEEPQKVVCKVYDENSRKQSIDTVSSTEKEFLEIDKATRELEREISKLNSALNDEDLLPTAGRLSVSEIRKRYDNNDTSSPNPIPKPRRSHYGGSNSP